MVMYVTLTKVGLFQLNIEQPLGIDVDLDVVII